MSVVVTGSIATDQLMSFPGRFREQLIDGQLDVLSVSFLVDDLELRRGGVAANIAFGLGQLGHRPVLVGAVGPDFDDYRAWLDRHNVDTSHVRVSATKHTSRFMCTTDLDQNQIASFYAGAMAETREIDLAAVAATLDEVDLVIIGAADPVGMLRHTDYCRDAGVPFAADPSQQLARMDGPDCRRLIDGATYLFTNEYERELLQEKTRWSADEILRRVDTWITTKGAKGARVESPRRHDTISVNAVPARVQGDPTGGGDAFRAGFVSGVAWRLDIERCVQVGCMLATLVVETVGPQEYVLSAGEFVDRFAETYGMRSAVDVADRVRDAAAAMATLHGQRA